MYEGAKVHFCFEVVFCLTHFNLLHHVYQYKHLSLKHMLRDISQIGYLI